VIRAAAPDDAETLAAIERAIFGGGAWSATQVLGTLGQPGGFGLVYEQGGRAVGHVLGWALVGEAELLRIGVHPDERRAGHGARLLSAFHAEVAERDAEHLFLEVRADNTPAQGLYIRAGWVEAGRRRRYYRDGVDALVFTWGAED
jgi:[ribosomal protein S18]-alanine N-acetyltransferase